MSAISDYPILTDYIRTILRDDAPNTVQAIRGAATDKEAGEILSLYSIVMDGDYGYGSFFNGLHCAMMMGDGRDSTYAQILRELRDNGEFAVLIGENFEHRL